MLRHKYISTPVLFFMCLVSSLSFSQTPEYKDYTVVKGDTLWDISTKELKDPFLWPKVWKENPEIKNPDLIYPGQKIRIPLYLLQKEIKPAVKLETKPEVIPEVRVELKPEPLPPRPVQKTVKPVIKNYLVDKNLLIISGYITDSVHSIGSIYDKPGEITNLSKGEYAYVSTDQPVKKGDKFYIIYPVEEVKHPVTGRKLGTRIAILGTAEVMDDHDPKILITNSYVEIPIGSLIDDYYEIEPPLAVDSPRKPDVNGHIVTALRRIYAHGNWDVVFIDKGENDGLAPGDLLATTWQSNHKILNGVVQIISTKPTTSVAIIRKAAREIQIGDPVIPITQE
jgi:LysM repeat protein